MAHFAKISNGKVIEVIVAEQEYINTLSGEWIETSKQTYKGEHKLGGTPLRKNFAGVGFIYDKERDAFYQKSPFPSWVLDEDTCHWEAPVARPNDDKHYKWNEQTTTWDEIE